MYSYNILPTVDEARFEQVCKTIEERFPNIKIKWFLEDVDGSLYKAYELDGKTFEVNNDYLVGALYIDSEVNLDDLFKEYKAKPLAHR